MLLQYTHELPMGHRLPNHPGKCKHLHGHNYLITISLPGKPNHDGMIMDFSQFKREIRNYFEQWDHAMVLWDMDPAIAAVSQYAKVLILLDPPTAERLCERWATDLNMIFGSHGIELTVFETRDCAVSHGIG